MRGSSGLQVRAGEGESEAEGYVLTNPVAKTSMSSGLSSKGKAQVEQIYINCTEASHCPILLMKYLLMYIFSSHFRRNMQSFPQSVQAAGRTGM